MSRSIHATRHAWWELGTWQFSDPTEQIEVRAELAREKIKKRRIKRHVIRERGSVDERVYCITDVHSIPIEVFDTGPFLHYPASIADLRAVLELLPAGVTDGIMGIELRSGRSEQADEAARCSCVPDPFTGRVGTQVLPGVFAGHILGTYMPRTARIHLFAYVYEPSLPDREMWELLLRGHMLGTLAHEVELPWVRWRLGGLDSRGHRGLVLTIVLGFIFSWWDVPNRAVQALMIPPVHPLSGGQLHVLVPPPGWA